MNFIFYLSALVAIVSTMLVITQLNAIHALLYLIVSLLAVAMIFFTLGAPFVAALEVIVYAGAIMVLFVFVMMTLNLGPQAVSQERAWLNFKIWIGPSALSLALLLELAAALATNGETATLGASAVDPRQVGIALFGPYLLGVELASMVLLSGLVGAYHLGQRERKKESELAAIRKSEIARTGEPESARAPAPEKEVEHVH